MAPKPTETVPTAQNVIPWKAEAQAPAPMPPPEPEEMEPDDIEHPYRALGHDGHKAFFILSKRLKKILMLSSHELGSESTYSSIAPREYWLARYPGPKGMNVHGAADYIKRQCAEAGVFDPSVIRGRGAWWDAGRTVVHMGNHLIVDGARQTIEDFGTEFIYESGVPLMKGKLPHPLSGAEALAFLELCRTLRWREPWMGNYFAGWCVCAMVCGALAYRPHIWLCGGSGSGKTHVEGQIVFPVMGSLLLRCQGVSTEAGIRRALRCDARPVWFDEAETEGGWDRQRLQQVMNLVRAASSEDAPAILKGSMSGGEGAVRFLARFCMAFSSINPQLRQQADANRIMVLELEGDSDQSESAKVERKQQYEALLAMEREVLTPEFTLRLLTRCVKLIPQIRENAITYSRAAVEFGGTQRLADQIGAVLSGLHALHRTDLVTHEDARAYLLRNNWARDQVRQDPAMRDENRLVQEVFQHVLTIRLGNGASYERAIGDIVAYVAGKQEDGNLILDAATAELKRRGIIWEKGYVWFADRHTELEKILKDTPWGACWARVFARVRGAQKSKNAMRFGAGVQQRAVGIPDGALDKQQDELRVP